MLLLIRDTRRLCLIAISVCVCLCACALRVLPVLFRVYPPTVQIGPLNVDIRGVNIWQYLNVGKVLPASTVLLNCQLWNRLFFSLVEVTEMTCLTGELLRWIIVLLVHSFLNDLTQAMLRLSLLFSWWKNKKLRFLSVCRLCWEGVRHRGSIS